MEKCVSPLVNAFLDSMGYPITSHEELHRNKQVTNTVFGSSSTIKPFTLQTFFVSQIGRDRALDISRRLKEQFGNGEFARLQNAIENGSFTQEEIEQLREEIVKRMDDILGKWKYLTVGIWMLSDIENAVGDLLLGDEVEKLRKYATEIELPEDLFENACEDP